MHSAVIDIHCDLLSYMQEAPDPDPSKNDDIGCTFNALEAGKVKLQVMAIYTATEKGSTDLALKQSLIFKKLLTEYNNRLLLINETSILEAIPDLPKLGILAAIENASGFCEEDEAIEDSFRKLENIISNTGKILYIGLTHHGENRFGGGNSTKTGLKEDGRLLLNYLNGRKIAIDLSHASDQLAYDILDYLSNRSLDISVIASHSNFRKVFEHPRNLPDDIAKEIIRRNGLIGINFLRAFLNNHDPNAIYDHIGYGIDLGGKHAICFGADYFYTKSHPDQSRKPFFFKEHENAGCYPSILKNLSDQVAQEVLTGISSLNVTNFIRRIWG